MIIDWLSFTVETEPAITDDDDEIVRAIYRLKDEIREQNPVLNNVIERMRDTEPTSERLPYNLAWRSPDGMTIYMHPALPHALIEFSGQGCQWLRDNELLHGVLAWSEDRITRIDVAQDLPQVTVDEIVSKGFSGRFRTVSQMKSDTGNTFYIGSQKSERYCRVYRYAPPHPRSEILRIEICHRKQYAKILAGQILSEGLDMAGKQALKTFEFQHPQVKRIVDGVEKLPSVPVNKDAARTERWLIAQAAPAFKKLVSDGVIVDPVAWLQEHFLGDE